MDKTFYTFIVMAFCLLIFSPLMAKDSAIKTEAIKTEVIIDSDITFAQAMAGTKAPQIVIDSMAILGVRYYSTDGKLHAGQLVVNKAVAEDVKAIFNLIKELKFPINHVIPIVKYDWSDDASMADNNTSAFNYRFIAGTERLSNHSFGRALDINPFFNPVIYSDGRISPHGAKYNKNGKGVFTKNNPIVKEFIKRGWRWGGDFKSFKDNHHFDKTINK